MNVNTNNGKKKYIVLFVFQVDYFQNRGTVCHTGLYMDSGPVPVKPFLPGPLHHPQLPAGHIPVHRTLSAKQGGRPYLELCSYYILLFHNLSFKCSH